ncbi:Acyl-CoA dehydrogenase [Desulfamplus magnetovallimortis]|uniref:Acyl-CoA dehydrogenase n=1 Tax=Desulfamplus magnetovallimortis TaxID=1246637 RepID=L0R3R2_9BACT|nr:acyl-CoA dehydrogenase family protein [Desulfamplus magnetovallimortis]CCO06623.1 Acyl-CoA dehydrogenase [Desulfamplus magnetovallimortis BW-1]SLM32674.1 Acyl-CoA dehydrogenase [Desulfamplus magnetovallimortis]
MDIFLTEKHQIVRHSVRAFAQREIIPIAKEIDEEQRFPWEVVEKMAALGYLGVQAPKELGGAGMDTVSYTLIIEELSNASAALGLCASVHNSVALYPLLAFGNREQHERFVPDLASGKKIGAFCLTEPNAGSDASSIEATAILDGDHYIVNANKVFVTNGGIAETCLIFVRTDPAAGSRGISVIVAEKGTPGFVVGENENLSGMRANPVSSIRLSECRIPKENLLAKEGMGLKIGLAGLDTGRIGIAAQAVGIAQASLDEGIKYAKERIQFKVPIANHQSIQNMIADMGTKVEAARLMVYRAALLKDMGKPFSKEAAMAKLMASETACQVADMAVQIHGGYGYSKSYPVERYYRDARVTRIYEGTSEVHRIVIARNLLS